MNVFYPRSDDKETQNKTKQKTDSDNQKNAVYCSKWSADP